MNVRRFVKRADGGKGRETGTGRASFADVRLRAPGDRFAEERRSAEERRRAVAYGRARGRL